MSGHQHLGGPSMTQNQGNVLGDRPCVRQSRLYRQHDGGNAMKQLMGQEQLMWDTNRTQGAYDGRRVYDHDAATQQNQRNQQQYQQQQQQQQAPQPLQPRSVQQEQPASQQGHRRGAGHANKSSYNILTGE